MCGIAGILNFDETPVKRADLETMKSFLKERGPDAEGILQKENIGLVHTRLSIVDLSEAGNQPMSDPSHDIHLVFNGEIYNFKELRNRLVESGHEFNTATDSEVLLKGYLEWGTHHLAQEIDGQFAFVLVDLEKKKAFAVRDRFGQKPLYYSLNGSGFVFSSDIRGVASQAEKLSIDNETLDFYFSELSSPQPKTIWEQIEQVKPGDFLEVDLETRVGKPSTYWSIDFGDQVEMDVEEAVGAAEIEIEKAVVRRIHGDVPMGTFLSSGVDSGLVTAFLAKNSGEPIKTFTIAVDYEKYDESEHAREVARRYGTDHHEIRAEAGDLLQVVESLIEYCGEPFADSSLIPSHLICKAISGEVKVALSGDGGDEMFGGYFNYADAYAADKYQDENKGRGGLAKAVALNLNKGASRLGLTQENKGNAAAYAEMSGADRLYRMMGFSSFDKVNLYTGDFASKVSDSWKQRLQAHWDSTTGNSITDKLRESSLRTRLLNDYLVKVDRASMFNSIEVRSPFLDHHLAQSIARIKSSTLLKGGITKLLTKKLSEKYIDPDMMNRPKKGFGIPVSEWLRGDLREPVRDLLENSIAVEKGILVKESVLTMFDDHVNGRLDSTNKIWAMFCLEIWLRKFA